MYGLVKPFKQRIGRIMEEVTDEIHVVTGKFTSVVKSALKKVGIKAHDGKAERNGTDRSLHH